MIELHPHQEYALEHLRNGSILWGGVGSGKSRIAAAYYIEKEAPKDVYVITTAKKRDSLDWEKEFVRYGVGRAPDATVAGVLTVDSWNNIQRYQRVVGALFIFDEQRLVGSGKWTKAFLKIAKKNHWILLSATPGDTWLDYIPVFIANGFYKNRTEFKMEHVVYNTYTKFPKVDRYTGVGKLVRLRNKILVKVPYNPHTMRKSTDVEVEFNPELYNRVVKDRWHVYEDRPIRDVGEMFLILRKIVNSDISRLLVVKQLLCAHPKLIVFYNFDFELELLRTISNVKYSSENNAENGQIKCLTQPLVSTEYLESQLNCQKNVESFTASVAAPISLDQNFSEISFTNTTRIPTSLFIAQKSIKDPNRVISQSRILSKGVNSWNTKSTSLMSCGTKTQTEPSGNINTTLIPTKQNGSNVFLDHDAPLVIAEWNGHKHQTIPDSDRWLYLVQYAAGAEGWNCTDTDAMCFYSLTYSYKLWHQAHGRIDRLNTPYNTLYYYVLKSRAPIDYGIARALMSKRNFNESHYSDVFADIVS